MQNESPNPAGKKAYSPIEMIEEYLSDNKNLPSSFQNFLNNRLGDQIKWYDNKSIVFKRKWERNRRWVIILSACIPFAVGLINQSTEKNVNVALQFLVGAAGVVIAIMEGFNSLSKSQELYIDYRVTAGKLQQQFSLFLGGAGEYAGGGDAAYAKLVNNVETIIASENKSWAEIAKQNDPKEMTDDIQNFVQAYLEKYGYAPLKQSDAGGTATPPVDPENGGGGTVTPPVDPGAETPPVVPTPPVDTTNTGEETPPVG